MIKGIGIDLIEIERIKKASQNKKFLKRIFTESEISYCLSKKNKYQHLAVRFAAKEAFKKAINSNISWKEIEIIKENNKPKINILNKKIKNKKIFLSLSHSDKYAVAIVIIF